MTKSCPICEQRRGRRFCPGLSSSRWRGEGTSICAQCCGEQREASIDCPGDCPFLLAAHRYEKERRPPPATPAFSQIQLDADFLDQQQYFLTALTRAIAHHGGAHPELHDPDVMTALEALARGYQTLDSGLYYEQPPGTLPARALYAALQNFIAQWQQQPPAQPGTLVSGLRPADILRALVFLRRLGDAHANGRPLGRGFLGFLQAQFPESRESSAGPRLIIPAN